MRLMRKQISNCLEELWSFLLSKLHFTLALFLPCLTQVRQHVNCRGQCRVLIQWPTETLKAKPKCIFFTDFDGTITLQDSTCFSSCSPTRIGNVSQAMIGWCVHASNASIVPVFIQPSDRSPWLRGGITKAGQSGCFEGKKDVPVWAVNEEENKSVSRSD